jgi:hypothetical protein
VNGTGIRILKWTALVVPALLLGKCGFDGWAGSLDPGPERWRSIAMQLAGHPGPRYLDVSVDLTVEGEPITISRVIECWPYFYHELGSPFLPSLVPAHQAITHRLQTGAGVIVVIPPAQCFSGARPLPGDYIPLIAWVDDADNPTVIEAYFSGTLVRSSEARVRFRDMRIRNSTDLERVESPDEFGWWRNLEQAGYKQDQSVPADWFAIFGRLLERPQWQTSQTLSEMLERAGGPLVLTSEPAKAARDIAPLIFPTAEIVQGQAQGDQERIRSGLEDEFRDVVPLRRVDGALAPSVSERGTIVYYRTSELMRSGIVQKQTDRGELFPRPIVSYDLSGQPVKAEAGRSLFDPASAHLINVTSMQLRFLSKTSSVR